MRNNWTIDDVIKALSLIKEKNGNLPVEILQHTKYGCLPKESFDIGVCSIDGRSFVDMSDVWERDE